MVGTELEALEPVETAQEIRASISEFNHHAPRYADRAKRCLRQTTNWVFDQDSGLFGPSKFVGYKSMKFAKYERAITENIRKGRLRFMPPLARENFNNDIALSDSLRNWGESLLGPDAFGTTRKEWRFFVLTDNFVAWQR